MLLRRWVNIERLMHSIKTVIAVSIGILLTMLFHFPASQWIVITIIVVMCAQIYVGSVFHKAYLRFLGTIGGCLFATATIVILGDTSLAILLAVCLSSFIFSFMASKEELSYASTLGAVTTAIIMLGQTPTITLAAERFLEISIGIFIATLVSQFVLPIHAGKHLQRTQAETLEKLRDYYQAIMMTPPEERKADYQDLEESIVKSILKQRQLAKESTHEPASVGFDPNHFTQSLYCEREILRTITFMHSALRHLDKLAEDLLEQPSLLAFNQTVSNTLNILIETIDGKKAKHFIGAVNIDELKVYIEKKLSSVTKDEAIYLSGILFSAEILADSLTRLTKLYHLNSDVA